MKNVERVWKAAHNVKVYESIVEVLKKVKDDKLSIEDALKVNGQYLSVHKRKYDEAKEML